jgi:hypothetical protein
LRGTYTEHAFQVHGTGEAIRGNFNAAVDQAAGDKSSAIKHKEVAQKGVDEWDRGYRGHGMQYLADVGDVPD